MDVCDYVLYQLWPKEEIYISDLILKDSMGNTRMGSNGVPITNLRQYYQTLTSRVRVIYYLYFSYQVLNRCKQDKLNKKSRNTKYRFIVSTQSVQGINSRFERAILNSCFPDT